MKKFDWTDDQRDAIEARGGFLLVSAAAGSGKTRVLVERVIRMITDADDPVDIDRLLIVTFTRAAAAEMKQRISQELSKLLKKDPFNKELLRQQLLLPKAQISTIDSFCSTILREFFYELDIPSDFRVIDDTEKEMLITQALDTVLEKAYSSESEDMRDLLESYSNAYDDKPLRDILKQIQKYTDAQPFPESWAAEQIKNYETDGISTPWDTVWGGELERFVSIALGFLKQQVGLAFDKAHAVADFTKAQTLTENELAYTEHLESLFDRRDWDGMGAELRAIEAYFKDRKQSQISFKNAKDGENKIISEQIKSSRNLYKEVLREQLEPLFMRDSKSFFEEVDKIAPNIRAIFSLISEFSAEYSRLKLEKNAADYADLEHRTLRLLVRETQDGFEQTETARLIASRYDHVLVDEYQDVNRVQDTIFNVVSDSGKRLFVVGDVKQSIYRFRQAMPEIFIERRTGGELYKKDSPKFPAVVQLGANFRCRSGVTNGVNYVFSKIMSKEVGELDYTSDEALVPLAEYPETDVTACEFHLLGLNSVTGDDRFSAEARYIGGLIKKMMKTEQVFDEGVLRRPRYSDFCILMRADKTTSSVYAKELERLNIPTLTEKGGSYFSQPEIRLMTSFLRALDNPARELPLAAALISPLFDFTSEEIGAMRARFPDKSLFEALLEMSEQNAKAKYFCETFEKLRSCAENVTADELIRRIYNETLLPEIVLTGEDGEFRRKNLRLLAEYAKTYEESGFRGISGFVAFLERLRENGKDLSAASRTGSAALNAVALMTIHKSKGLEFPFCIVANLGGGFNKKDFENDIVIHSKAGVGMNVINSEKMYRYKGITRNITENSILMSMISEELRILYVAMTRAKERLILTGFVKDVHKEIVEAASALAGENGRVPPYLVLSAPSFERQLLYCLLTSKSARWIRDSYGLDLDADETDKSEWEFVLVDNITEHNAGVSAVKDSNSESVSDGAAQSVSAAEDKPDEDDISAEFKAIKKKLTDEYKYADACGIQVKLTASAAVKNDKNYGAESRPSFMNTGSLSAAQKGTALHAFAQYCDFEKARVSIGAEKDRLVKLGHLTQAQADSISEWKVRRFLESPLLDEMLSAQMLEREYQYMAEIPAGLADPTLPEEYRDEKVILQGAIDCIYELDGELVIVDYKTDRGRTADELALHYTPQLRLYKYAAEQIFGKEVSRCVLYSFGLSEEIEVDV